MVAKDVLLVIIFFSATICFQSYFLWYLQPRPCTSTPSLKHEAIITIVSSEHYLPGALTLGYTLQRHELVKRDLIALIPHAGIKEQRHLDMLRDVGWTPVLVPAIPLPGKTDWKFVDMLVKLYAWNYTKYDVVGIIDSDAMLVGSIEGPFELMGISTAPVAACMAPVKVPSPPFNDKMAGHFNAGVMFIRPNFQHFHELLSLSRDPTYYDLSLAEQNLLNEYYHGRWLGLPITYNLITMFATKKVWEVNRPAAKVIHFAGPQKPWSPCGDQCDSLLPEERMWRTTFGAAAAAHAWRRADFTTSKIQYDIGELLHE